MPGPDTQSNATHANRLTAATSVRYLRSADEPVLRLPDETDTFPVLRVEDRITAVRPRQESKNGNAYTALSVDRLDAQVFVWHDAWRRELEEHMDAYTGLSAVLWVRDKDEHPANHYYNLEAVVPQDRERCRSFFRRHCLETTGYDPVAADPPEDLNRLLAQIGVAADMPTCDPCDVEAVRVGDDLHMCPDCGRRCNE